MSDAPSKESLERAEDWLKNMGFGGRSPLYVDHLAIEFDAIRRERNEAAEKLAEAVGELRCFVKDVHDWMHEQRKVRNTLDERFMRTATVLADIDASLSAWREREGR